MGIVVLLQSVGGGDLIRLLGDGYDKKKKKKNHISAFFQLVRAPQEACVCSGTHDLHACPGLSPVN
jgi:predicted MPP superfamily phosphohydrolase